MANFLSNFKSESNKSVGLSFLKVYNLWHRSIKSILKSVDLTHPQFIVLASLGYLEQKNNNVTQIQISEKSNIDVMTVSIIIKNLEKNNFITKSQSPKDVRANSITLTNKGRSKLNEALPMVEKNDKIFFGVLGSQSKMFNDMLLKLQKENDRKL